MNRTQVPGIPNPVMSESREATTMVTNRSGRKSCAQLWSQGWARAFVQVGVAVMVAACGGDPGPVEQTGLTAMAIRGGGPSAPGSRPSAAFIEISDTNGNLAALCTGTLIAPDWVLTAKHCTNNPSRNISPIASSFNVIVGRQDLSTTAGEEVAVADVLPHGQDDLALLELQHPVTVPVSRLLSPARAFEVPYGSSVVIAGWGLFDASGQPSTVLREGEVQLLGKGSDCDGVPVGSGVYIHGPLSIHRVCLGSDPWVANIADADSGGPTWVQRDGEWFLAAVHSSSAILSSEDTWVPDFFDWLLQKAPGQHPSYLSSAQITAIL